MTRTHSLLFIVDNLAAVPAVANTPSLVVNTKR